MRPGWQTTGRRQPRSRGPLEPPAGAGSFPAYAPDRQTESRRATSWSPSRQDPRVEEQLVRLGVLKVPVAEFRRAGGEAARLRVVCGEQDRRSALAAELPQQPENF